MDHWIMDNLSLINRFENLKAIRFLIEYRIFGNKRHALLINLDEK